ncbi:Xanthine dehydrogenase [Nymphon striatum]|nr:Xanthine dehydrogenase [Nymphon striatum]
MVVVTFKINGNGFIAGEDLGPHVTLNDFIRDHANLKGTKKMCAEGGCGCCVAHVSYQDSHSKNTVNRSINTCMMPIYACDGWEITTIEGLGNKHTGYHSIQKRLADYNGTQCGYCSPGFVMNMYGILANDPKPSKQNIDSSFDGNICRCTGYRPILDAMRSFADDNNEIPDIEVNKACCGKRGYVVCNNSCKLPEHSEDDFVSVSNNAGTKMLNHSDGIWYKAVTLKDCLELLKQTKDKKVRLVVGNTGSEIQPIMTGNVALDQVDRYTYLGQLISIHRDWEPEVRRRVALGWQTFGRLEQCLAQQVTSLLEAEGVFKYDGPYDYYIDIRNIPELHEITNTDSEITFGAAVTLTQLIEEFKEKTKNLNDTAQTGFWNYFSSPPNTAEGWQFCEALARHISYTANFPVRNAGCWAGNLKMKHDHNDFPSDMFTIMEAAGATVTVGNYDGTTKKDIAPSDFIKMDMEGKMLLKLHLKKLTSDHIMRTFKITIRSQSADAYINAGFMFEISNSENFKVKSKPSIVFGGVNKDFHTIKLFSGALAKLESEVKPNSDPILSSVTYRKSLCVSLLYKFILGVIGKKASPEYQSGGLNLERPMSEGKRTFYTNQSEWPLTKPVPKLEALIQCSGEAQYAGDHETLSGQLYGAFVPSSVGNATLKSINTKIALSIPGVVRVIIAKDIPGVNNFAAGVFHYQEELLASTQVNYQGQPIAIVLAETEYLAEKGAKAITAEYTNVQTPIIEIRKAIEKKSFWNLDKESSVISGNIEEGFENSDQVFEGEIETGSQYHFYIETQTAYCVPSDIGLDVYSASQRASDCQTAIANVLGIKQNEINMVVKRLGGAYGGKLGRSLMTGSACALAAHLTNRPVMMHLPLETNMRIIGKRIRYLGKYKVGVTNDGKLNAVHITYYDDVGSSPNEETGTNVIHFGDSAWLQGATFIESVMEDVAYHLGLEPIDVKANNLIKDGQKKAGGKVILNCLLSGMVEEFREMSNFDVRKAEIKEFNKNNQWKKKGLACVMMRYPYHYSAIRYNSMVSIYAHDGTISISHGGIEMGQGINTKAAQVCAYVFGIPLSMVNVKPTTSLISPNQDKTGGSLGSDLISFVCFTCETLRDRMAPIKKKMKNPEWLDLIKECEKNNLDLCVRNTYSPSDVPEGYDIYGMTATEVEVDVLTGMVQIPRADILYDGGESSNEREDVPPVSMSPDVDIGQIEGAFVMGLGLMLCEELKFDLTTGELLTKNTFEYKPPTTKDIPIKFNIKFLKNAKNPLGVLGSKATGEPPLCMTGSALFAISDAIQSARKDAGDTKRIFIGNFQWFSLINILQV